MRRPHITIHSDTTKTAGTNSHPTLGETFPSPMLFTRSFQSHFVFPRSKRGRRDIITLVESKEQRKRVETRINANRGFVLLSSSSEQLCRGSKQMTVPFAPSIALLLVTSLAHMQPLPTPHQDRPTALQPPPNHHQPSSSPWHTTNQPSSQRLISPLSHVWSLLLISALHFLCSKAHPFCLLFCAPPLDPGTTVVLSSRGGSIRCC